MDRSSLIFCAVSLLLSLLVAAALFPFTTLTDTQLQASATTTDADQMGEVDLGDFGTVSVQELVDYYVENPPVETAAEAPARVVRFQGC